MKKKKSFWGLVFPFALMLMLAGAAFASCGDDSDEEETPGGDKTETPSGGVTEENGHKAVDLGLPSGTKWATCNVGASKPEEYGGYYAWGETEEKENYSWTTYQHCDGSANTCHNLGDDIAGTEYDVAHVKWGGSWEMPTKTQMDELINTNYCTWTWTARNGINGYEVKSKMNGNSIFLPAAGYRGGLSFLEIGSGGDYWSSTANEKYYYHAFELRFRSDNYRLNDDFHYSGQLVRPVLK